MSLPGQTGKKCADLVLSASSGQMHSKNIHEAVDV